MKERKTYSEADRQAVTRIMYIHKSFLNAFTCYTLKRITGSQKQQLQEIFCFSYLFYILNIRSTLKS